MKSLIYSSLLAFTLTVLGQNKPVKFYLSKDSTNYLQLNGLGQVWGRYTQANPGSTIKGEELDHIFDIGIRRWRFVIQAQLSKKTFFYTQFGQNNFNFRSPKYVGSFFHDAFGEYHFLEKKFAMGIGLSGWNGLSRFSSPSIGTMLPLDVPVYQQTTNGVNDQWVRKLSIHAKGLIGKLNYRVAITNPMMVNETSVGYDTNLYQDRTTFSIRSPKPQFQGYFIWHFKDTEYSLNPYNKGTYLGEKEIVNLGFGFLQQKDAMWMLNENNDTTFHQFMALGADIFIDKPTNENHAITIYGAYHYFDYGKNYIKNVGVMNPFGGSNRSDILNGAGNAYPLLGTGSSFYGQIGYLFKNIGKQKAGLQPYLVAHLANYEALDELMNTFNIGANYLIHGQRGKVSLDLQNRPVYEIASDGTNSVSSRMNMVVLQYQLTF